MVSPDMRSRAHCLALVLSGANACAYADYPAAFSYWPSVINPWGMTMMMMPLAAPHMLLAVPQQIPVLPVMPGTMMPLTPTMLMQVTPSTAMPALLPGGEAQSWPPPLPPVPFQPAQEGQVAVPVQSARAVEPPGGLGDSAQPHASSGQMIPEKVEKASLIGATSSEVGLVPPAGASTKAKSRPKARAKPASSDGVAPPRKLCWNHGVVDACEKSTLPKPPITK